MITKDAPIPNVLQTARERPMYLSSTMLSRTRGGCVRRARGEVVRTAPPRVISFEFELEWM